MNAINEMVSDEGLVADGFERVKGDLAALEVEDLQQLNVDVQSATRTILGALPEVRALRDRMVKELPAFDIASFDKLEDYVQAMKYAQSGVQIATQPPNDLPALLEAGHELHDRLLADANALAKYKLFDAAQLEHLKGGTGLNNLAEDLELLSRAMLANWAKLQGKALTPLEDVQTASRIGLRLTRIAGLREQAPARLAAATELRLRAFTILLRTYEEARDAIRYLRRHEGDLEMVAPSLYPGRARHKSTPTEDPPPPPVVTSTPAVKPGAPATAGATPPAAQLGSSATQSSVKDPFMS